MGNSNHNRNRVRQSCLKANPVFVHPLSRTCVMLWSKQPQASITSVLSELSTTANIPSFRDPFLHVLKKLFRPLHSLQP